MHTTEIAVTREPRGITDLTAAARAFAQDKGDGLLNVFAPHSTVGLALIQAGDGSDEDVVAAVHRLLPRGIDYAHVEKAPGHGADHVVPALISPSITVPVVGGVLMLGTWQQVVMVDLDEEPTPRRVRLSFVAG